MKIAICGSINFSKEILKTRDDLTKMGHEAFIPKSLLAFSIKDAEGAEKLKSDRRKYINEIKPEYTREHFGLIEKSDAILVVNIEKNGVKNYIGGATFAEIMVALYLGKKIFFLNPIPAGKNFSFMLDELEAAKPVILNGNIKAIK